MKGKQGEGKEKQMSYLLMPGMLRRRDEKTKIECKDSRNVLKFKTRFQMDHML